MIITNYARTGKCPMHQCLNCGEVFRTDEEPTEQMLKDLEESEKSGTAFSGTPKEALAYLDKLIKKGDKKKSK